MAARESSSGFRGLVVMVSSNYTPAADRQENAEPDSPL
jgi:hypothetical protein